MTLAHKSALRVTALIAALLAVAIYLTPAASQQNAIAELGGSFKLASSNGGEVDSASLVGQPYGVFFGFSHCPEVCPTTLYNMTKSLASLGSDAKYFRLFFVTVDPERDTAPVLKDYLSNFDPRIEALVPTMQQLPVIARQFHAYYEKVPGSDGEYTMNHTALIYLFNAQGRFTSTIAYDESLQGRETKLKNLITNN